uniref:FAM171 N-terminal domain-containing protein n=1 Tax=Electrophorus electricus TaxID=8005 RepID=A0A4W4HCT8_ELEEL
MWGSCSCADSWHFDIFFKCLCRRCSSLPHYCFVMMRLRQEEWLLPQVHYPPPEPTVTLDSAPPEPSSLTLKVSVKDASSQRFLSGAAVLVFVNGSRLRSSRTQDGGEVLLTVPYQLGATLTLVASMDAYVPSQFRWKTTKMPIFSSVTMSLLPQTQGNIWLFEDNVLITRKTADLSSQPNVQFPKDLISLPENTTISMVTAYLTVTATPPEKDSHFSTLGVVNNKGGTQTWPLRAHSRAQHHTVILLLLILRNNKIYSVLLAPRTFVLHHNGVITTGCAF